MKTKIGILLLAGLLCQAATTGARAERYLSETEVQSICFPQADRFEAREAGLSTDERKAIESQAKTKVSQKRCRFVLAHQSGALLGVLIFDQVLGKHDLIDYAVAVSPEGKILHVELLEYREKFGAKIGDANWRGQFVGKSSAARLKLNEDIYNISGATISCRHVTEGVKRVLATYDLVVRPQLGVAGRLPDLSKAPKP